MSCAAEPNPAIQSLQAGDDRYLKLGGGPDKITPFRAPVSLDKAGYTFVGLGDTGLCGDVETGFVWWRQRGVNLYRMDQGGGGGGSLTYEAINLEASPLSAGLAVAPAIGGVELADQATDTPSAPLAAVGVVVAPANAGALATIQTQGPLILADWTAATGAATLTEGARYWLGEAGLLVSTAPSSGLMQVIGTAAASDTLVIQPQILGRRVI